MQFLNPIWLWGLTGLIIPIGIHLLSRKDGKVIRIGSVRYLEDTNTKQFRSVRLNEILLLLLRCLLLAMIVFMLSGLHFKGIEEDRSRWLLIENGLQHDRQFSSLIDSLTKKGFEIKSLMPGFPNLKDSIATNEKVNYWSIADDISAMPLDEVVVLSYNYADGFKGKRIAIPDNIRWISKNPDPRDFTLFVTRFSEDSAFVRVGKSNGSETRFEWRKIRVAPGQHHFPSAVFDSVSIQSPDTISLAVISDSTFAYDRNILMAAFGAVKESSPTQIRVEVFDKNRYLSDQKKDWIIELSDEPNPYPFNQNTFQFEIRFEHANAALLQAKKKYPGAHSWIFTERLHEEIALQENLPIQLALIVLPKEKYQKRAIQFDKRVLPEKLTWRKNSAPSNLKAGAGYSGSERIITIILLTILVIERLLAYKRNQ